MGWTTCVGTLGNISDMIGKEGEASWESRWRLCQAQRRRGAPEVALGGRPSGDGGDGDQLGGRASPGLVTRSLVS